VEFEALPSGSSVIFASLSLAYRQLLDAFINCSSLTIKDCHRCRGRHDYRHQSYHITPALYTDTGKAVYKNRLHCHHSSSHSTSQERSTSAALNNSATFAYFLQTCVWICTRRTTYNNKPSRLRAFPDKQVSEKYLGRTLQEHKQTKTHHKHTPCFIRERRLLPGPKLGQVLETTAP